MGSVCKVGTQDPENLNEELKPLVTVWSVPSLLSVLRHPFSYLGLTAHPFHVRSLRVSSPYVSATRRSSPGSFPRLSFTPVHFSSPGGLVPRAGKKGECWTFLDWRLNSENDSPVHGQPSLDSLLPPFLTPISSGHIPVTQTRRGVRRGRRCKERYDWN